MADSLTEQIYSELRQIEPIVSDILQLPSRWGGVVYIVDTPHYYGKKRFSCEIEIQRGMALSDARWRTLIHEMVHAHSVGLTYATLQGNSGWEEGPVEIFQRLIRPVVFARLQVSVEESEFAPVEAAHAHNRHVEDVETLRKLCNVEEEDAVEFYAKILQTPIAARRGVMAQRALSLAGIERVEFARRFSEISSRLREDI